MATTLFLNPLIKLLNPLIKFNSKIKTFHILRYQCKNIYILICFINIKDCQNLLIYFYLELLFIFFLFIMF